MIDLQLTKYRDAGMSTYTYFYKHEGSIVSPYFDSEREAETWLSEQIELAKYKKQAMELWNDSCTTPRKL